MDHAPVAEKDRKYDGLMLQQPQRSNSHQVPSLATQLRPSGTFEARQLSEHTNLAPAQSIETDDVKAMQDAHSKLRRKFKALTANFKTAKSSLRKRVEERDKWITYAKHLESLILAAEKKHGIRITIPEGPALPAFTPAAALVDGSGRMQNVSASEHSPSKRSIHDERACRETAATAAAATVVEQAAPNEPPESTQGDTDDGASEQLPQLPFSEPGCRLAIKQEPSSDEPVLVSARVVRKRKRGDSIPRTVEQPLKAEPASDSSPIISRTQLAVEAREDVDLGDIEQRLVTPRKQKDFARPALTEIAAASKLGTTSATRSDDCALSKKSSQQPVLIERPSVLTPLSVNKQKSGLAETKSGERPTKRGIAFAISVLAEDGGFYGTQPPCKQNNNRDDTPVSTHGRLHALLNGPPSAPTASDVIQIRPGHRIQKRQTPMAALSEIPGRRRLPFGAANDQSPTVGAGENPRRALPSNGGTIYEQSPLPKNTAKSRESLRAKPLLELRLDDFKVNPLANEGQDFAFADVVRDKWERACLPGCTDQHCCGKQFKALALSQRPDSPLNPAQRIEEQQLLEEYLGDQAYKLAAMGREERADLWLDAKAQELANRYGKHRHRFFRMQSPPGFWNADFPSTQELQTDRAEAAKRERQAIAGRHREAMRPGGRWLFKDE